MQAEQAPLDAIMVNNRAHDDLQGRLSVSERSKLADARERVDAVRGITEVLGSKNRKGSTDMELRFDGATTAFSNFSRRCLGRA